MKKLAKDTISILGISAIILIITTSICSGQVDKQTVKLEKKFNCSITSDSLDEYLDYLVTVDTLLEYKKYSSDVRVLSVYNDQYKFSEKEYYFNTQGIDSVSIINLMFVYLPHSEKKKSKEEYINLFKSHYLKEICCCD